MPYSICQCSIYKPNGEPSHAWHQRERFKQSCEAGYWKGCLNCCEDSPCNHCVFEETTHDVNDECKWGGGSSECFGRCNRELKCTCYEDEEMKKVKEVRTETVRGYCANNLHDDEKSRVLNVPIGGYHTPITSDNIDDEIILGAQTPSGYGLNENPFTSLNSVVYQDGQTAVTWTLDPNFEDQGPYNYYLEVALSDASTTPEDFERINPDNPVTDHSAYILDETIRRYSFDNRSVYRVVLETPRGVYISDPEKPNGELPPNLLRVYREILRKERLRLSPKLGGTAGTLFKRRTFGPKCDAAIDKNTGQVIDYNNEECYGTEFIGGYFEGLEYPMLYTSAESYSSEITPMGTQEPHSISARALVYPMPASKDVWYEYSTGRAFYINKVVVSSKFSTKPLSLKIDMRMAAPTDIVYDFIDVQAGLNKLK